MNYLSTEILISAGFLQVGIFLSSFSYQNFDKTQSVAVLKNQAY